MLCNEKSAVIVCGADIGNYEFVLSRISMDSYFIYCDSGLKHHEKLNRTPDLIIGDFDSYEEALAEKFNKETIKLPVMKDDTDSVYAVKEAIRRGFTSIIIIGAVGNRLDHTLGNIYSLIYCYENYINASIIDDYSEMKIIGNRCFEEITDKYPYFSIVAISGVAKGVCIENAKYPLYNAEIKPDYQYGISNEVIKGKIARVSVSEGFLLLIKVKKC